MNLSHLSGKHGFRRGSFVGPSHIFASDMGSIVGLIRRNLKVRAHQSFGISTDLNVEIALHLMTDC